MLIDTHCHLFMDPLARDVDAVQARAARVGVGKMVVPAFDLESWDALRQIGCREGIHPALGLHPWVADQVTTGNTSQVKDTAAISPGNRGGPNPTGPTGPAKTRKPMPLAEFRDHLAARLEECQAVAIGEIGLDFLIERPTAPEQLALLKTQLKLAADLDLPVILHCRNGWEMLVAALQPFAGRLRGVMHAYTRNPGLVGPMLKCGFFVGFGGTLTRPQAKRTRRSAEVLPLDRILLETDAPTSGLDGIDPEQTEPCHIQHVAEALAEIRETSVEQIAEVTTGNACELFRI